MVFEGSFGITLLFLAEASEVEWVMLAGGMDIVGEQIVVRNQVTLVGMIPEPAGILDQLPIVVDEGVVDGNHAVLTIARLWVVLQPFEPVRIDTVRLPRRFGQPAIQAGLVWSVGELARNAAHGLVLRNQQASQILGEVPS